MSMADEFKWDELEEEAVVVSDARETAAYFNPKGDVVIRQRASYPDEDTFVVIPTWRLPALIERLKTLLKDAQDAGTA
jgi:hypothetical protein